MQTYYVFACKHGQNFRFKMNTTRRCSNCLKTGFWYVCEVNNMPTSQHTRQRYGWEASEARMLLLVRARFCFLGLTFQPFPPWKYACQKERARSKTMHMHLTNYWLPLPCWTARARCACWTLFTINVHQAQSTRHNAHSVFFHFTVLNTTKRDF